MESVSVKFQEDILKRMDTSIAEHNFNSRTEFIREAVRDKLEGLSKEELLQKFLSLKGSIKKKTSYAEEHRRKIEAGKELMEELAKRFA